MTDNSYEELQSQQMQVFADMLDAFQRSADLSASILESLTFADFSNKLYIENLNSSIQSHAVATKALATAFHSYAQSHGLLLSE